MQDAPTKRFASAAPNPVFSEPAIGWLPIKLMPSETMSRPRVWWGETFTLPTSVTQTPCLRPTFRMLRPNSSRLSTGTARITRSASATASARLSVIAGQPEVRICLTRAPFLPQRTTALFGYLSRNANAIDPPRTPGPKTAMRQNSDTRTSGKQGPVTLTRPSAAHLTAKAQIQGTRNLWSGSGSFGSRTKVPDGIALTSTGSFVKGLKTKPSLPGMGTATL